MFGNVQTRHAALIGIDKMKIRILCASSIMLLSMVSLWRFFELSIGENVYLIVAVCAAELTVWSVFTLLIIKTYDIKLCIALLAAAIPFLSSWILMLQPLLHTYLRLDAIREIKLVVGITYVTFLYAQVTSLLYFHARAWQKQVWFSMRSLCIRLFIFVFSFYALLSVWTNAVIVPTGDEPYYLLAAASLLKDHDLNISDNYAEGNWKTFMKDSNLKIWKSKRSDGKIYMDERILFVAGLAVPFLIGGVAGASLFIVLMSSIFILMIFIFLLKNGFAAHESFWAAILCMLTQPMLTMNARIYHNVMGGIGVLLALMLLRYHAGSRLSVFVTTCIIVSLPWIHISNVILSILLFSFFVYNNRRYPRSLIYACVITCVSAVGFLSYRYHIQGNGSMLTGFIDYGYTTHFYRSLLALFFDQEAGLFFHTPLYVFSVIGFTKALRVDFKGSSFNCSVIITGGFLFVQGMLPAFGGGYDTGRSLILILPFLVLYALRAMREKHLRLMGYILAGLSVGWGFLTAAIPWLAINLESGRHVLLAIIETIVHLPIGNYLPSFNSPGAECYIGIVMFLLGMIAIGSFGKGRFVWH